MINRMITLQTKTEKIVAYTSTGCPQGDPLSPTIFNVYTAVLHNLTEEDIQILQYADDFSVIFAGKNLHTLQIKIDQFLIKFIKLSESLKLKINLSKTKAMIFGSNITDTLKIQVSQKKIEIVNSTKYLGVTIDKKLNFNKHFETIFDKVNNRMNIMKVLMSPKNGCHPQSALNIYKAVVQNFIQYAAPTITNTSKSNLQKLQVLINSCLRKVSGCTRSTPINTLTAITSISPIYFTLENIILREIAKHHDKRDVIQKQLQHLNNMDMNTKLITCVERQYLKHKSEFKNISFQTENNVKTTEKISNHISTLLNNEKIIKNKYSNNQLKAITLHEINTKYKITTKVYTDASIQNNQVGIGIYTETGYEMSKRLQDGITIMTAEIVAIWEALKWIYLSRKRDNTLNNVVILTDSQSACTWIQNLATRKRIPSLVHDILNLIIITNTRLQWIPGHVDITGNNKADELAKVGTTLEEKIVTPVFLKDALYKFKIDKYTKINNWYINSANEKGQKFFAIQDKFYTKPWFYNQNLGRTEIRTLNRVLSGHDYSKYYLNIFRIADDPLCDICGTIENAEHIILECVKYTTKRISYKFDKYTNLIEILKLKDYSIYKEIVSFLNEIEYKL